MHVPLRWTGGRGRRRTLPSKRRAMMLSMFNLSVSAAIGPWLCARAGLRSEHLCDQSWAHSRCLSSSLELAAAHFRFELFVARLPFAYNSQWRTHTTARTPTAHQRLASIALRQYRTAAPPSTRHHGRNATRKLNVAMFLTQETFFALQNLIDSSRADAGFPANWVCFFVAIKKLVY